MILQKPAICALVVAGEAKEQGKTAESHWADMTADGTLDRLGLTMKNGLSEARKMAASRDSNPGSAWASEPVRLIAYL